MKLAANSFELQPQKWGFCGKFCAMASPCELLIPTQDIQLATSITQYAYQEAHRIEQKYSRFIKHNDLWQLNHSAGQRLTIDSETFALLNFAKQCYELSDGRFDISAGPVIRLWRFNQGADFPSQKKIKAAKALIGFSNIHFDSTSFTMPNGMFLDFGGIGKEYAADKVATYLATTWPELSILVNFGGDIACPITRKSGWQVGIEDPNHLTHATKALQVHQGAIATSGDTHRYIEYKGKRYGHIIDPVTGYPVKGAPCSVTVLGPHCVAAGMLATMAMLQGEQAEDFLQQQDVQFFVFRRD